MSFGILSLGKEIFFNPNGLCLDRENIAFVPGRVYSTDEVLRRSGPDALADWIKSGHCATMRDAADMKATGIVPGLQSMPPITDKPRDGGSVQVLTMASGGTGQRIEVPSTPVPPVPASLTRPGASEGVSFEEATGTGIPAAEAPPPASRWGFDPESLKGKTIEALNLLIAERTEAGKKPLSFTDPAEAIAWLSQDFKKA